MLKFKRERETHDADTEVVLVDELVEVLDEVAVAHRLAVAGRPAPRRLPAATPRVDAALDVRRIGQHLQPRDSCAHHNDRHIDVDDRPLQIGPIAKRLGLD